MAETAIEWAHYTHNLWWGCQEILDPAFEDGFDPACSGCYARERSENSFWWGKPKADQPKEFFKVWGGPDTARRFFAEPHYLEPLKWNRAAEKARQPARVFCMSMGDLFEGRPDQRERLHQYFDIVEQTPWLIHLMLTKRPQLANSLVPEQWRRDGWPANAWPGTTAVTQKWANVRLPHLLRIPAANHFLSAEPLAEALDLTRIEIGGGALLNALSGEMRAADGEPICAESTALSWVIAGGKSGPQATPMNPAWPRSLRDQCKRWNVAFHYKQTGEYIYEAERRDWKRSLDRQYSDAPDGGYFRLVGKKVAGRELDGRTWDEVPAYEPTTKLP